VQYVGNDKYQKIYSDCRVFKENWSSDYIISKCIGEGPFDISNKTMAVLTEYNIWLYCESIHASNYTKYSGTVRANEVEAIRNSLSPQQNNFATAKNIKLQQELEFEWRVFTKARKHLQRVK
jgi:hypothetical protein